MSVILTLEDKVWTQGYGPSTVALTLTNSGTENIDDIELKVTDSVVFSVLKAGPYAATRSDALNVFCSIDISFSDSTSVLPAGTTKTMRLDVTVKASAPIQTHKLTCDFQYTTY